MSNKTITLQNNSNEILEELQDFIFSQCEGDIKTPLDNIQNTIIHYMDATFFDKEIQNELWILHEIKKILSKIIKS